MLPVTSGETSISASSDVDLIAAADTAGGSYDGGQITNGGAAEASFSVDGGTTWVCLPPTSALALPPGNYSNGIKVQGNSGTASGLSAVLWQGRVP